MVTINTLNGGDITITTGHAGHPDTRVTYTSESGFSDWSGEIVGELTSESIPNIENAETLDIGNIVTSIGYFGNDIAPNLTSVRIPGSSNNIGCYEDLYNLTTVTIENGVRIIDNNAFTNDSISSIAIPNSVINIGSYAFESTSVANVTIGSGVTTIGDGAFDNCWNLTSVTIPSNVTSIGEDAFYYCTSLTSITFEGKDKATVQGMTNYPFGLNDANENGTTIHCTDGDIQVSH